jgi:hypothetical protein
LVDNSKAKNVNDNLIQVNEIIENFVGVRKGRSQYDILGSSTVLPRSYFVLTKRVW